MYDIVIGRSKADREKFGTEGAILLGKQFITMGQTQTLSNKVYLDVTQAHVVFICGKRGGGKCLHGDTLITLSDGSLIPIKELAEHDTDVLSLNENLKIQTQTKTHFYKRQVEKVWRIKLRSGKSITMTPEHPLLTVDGWRETKDLDIGARIATPRIQPVFGELDMDEARVKMLAYMIAEGHCGRQLLFSNQDATIVQDFNDALQSIDKKLYTVQHSPCTYRVVGEFIPPQIKVTKRDESGGFIDCERKYTKNALRQLLHDHDVLGKKAPQKIIPQNICRLPKVKLALFLNRLFSCDGSIYQKKSKTGAQWEISYCSASHKLITQVSHLLLRFGILSTVRKKIYKQFTHYELHVKEAGTYTFLQEIGFFGKKIERAKKALLETPKNRNHNTDTIPKEIWNTYRPSNWADVGREIGYATPKGLRSSVMYAPSRQKLAQIAQVDHAIGVQKLAQSDIFWDEIASIAEINEPTHVYDITVPDLHNFVANDIIVHNSYTMGVIAEGLSDIKPEIAKRISIILLDTMGVYWTMKYPNKQDEELLHQWDMKPKGLDVQIYTPIGAYNQYKEQGIPTDFPFSIRPNELTAEDWLLTLELKTHSEMAVVFERIINDMQEEQLDYSLDDIMERIKQNKDASQVVKDALLNELLNAKKWGLFSEKGAPMTDLAVGGQVTVLDVSCYATQSNGWNIKSLVVGLLAKKVFIDRMVARKQEEYSSVHSAMHYFSESKEKETEKQLPLVWLVIDEAHEFLPVQGKTAATDALVTILREGRQPGVSLVLATQQPGKIHTDVMTQSDTVISHRITAKPDVDALGLLMQSYMRSGLTEQADALPRLKGAGLVFDDTNERLFPIRVRPRTTWHGGSSPNAMPKKKDYDL